MVCVGGTGSGGCACAGAGVHASGAQARVCGCECGCGCSARAKVVRVLPPDRMFACTALASDAASVAVTAALLPRDGRRFVVAYTAAQALSVLSVAPAGARADAGARISMERCVPVFDHVRALATLPGERTGLSRDRVLVLFASGTLHVLEWDAELDTLVCVQQRAVPEHAAAPSPHVVASPSHQMCVDESCSFVALAGFAPGHLHVVRLDAGVMLARDHDVTVQLSSHAESSGGLLSMCFTRAPKGDAVRAGTVAPAASAAARGDVVPDSCLCALRWCVRVRAAVQRSSPSPGADADADAGAGECVQCGRAVGACVRVADASAARRRGAGHPGTGRAARDRPAARARARRSADGVVGRRERHRQRAAALGTRACARARA